ncbi:unnamed protein product [Colias eurytheme]|nr:unnamed protein product [Colias eurytheme]
MIQQKFDTPIMKLLHERLDMIDCTMWTNTCRHVEETESKYWKNYDDEQEFIIHVGESDSENDTSSFYDSDEENFSSSANRDQ